MEGAISSTLEDKNSSTGFWSGIISGAGGLYTPTAGTEGWDIWNFAAKGILGGLGSMSKNGNGFLTGFVSAETTSLANYTNALNLGDKVWNDVLNIGEGAIGGGFASRLGGKTFSSGLFTGAASEFLQDVVPLLPGGGNPEKPPMFSGPVKSAFNLLQPKTVHGREELPLDGISAGSWGRGGSWAELFAPQAGN